jgi:ketosteroid isomerase-like protein
MATAITEKELLELERRYWQAMKDGDVRTAMELTDTPCIVAGAQGVGSFGKKDFERMFKTPTWKLEKFRFKEGAKMRRIADDVAVLAYEVHEELTVGGRPVSFDAADCSTWVRRDGRWLCASHTESIEGDPFAREKAEGSGTRPQAYE